MAAVKRIKLTHEQVEQLENIIGVKLPLDITIGFSYFDLDQNDHIHTKVFHLCTPEDSGIGEEKPYYGLS